MTSRDSPVFTPQVFMFPSHHGGHGLSWPPLAALDFTPFSQGVPVRPKASTELPHLLSSALKIQALLGVCEIPPILIIIKAAFCLFYSVDICIDNAKAVIGRTIGLLSQIKTEGPNCDSGHCAYYYTVAV